MNTDRTEEVGQQFNVTRERIRQIEAKALRKLKHPSRSRKLRSFLHDRIERLGSLLSFTQQQAQHSRSRAPGVGLTGAARDPFVSGTSGTAGISLR